MKVTTEVCEYTSQDLWRIVFLNLTVLIWFSPISIMEWNFSIDNWAYSDDFNDDGSLVEPWWGWNQRYINTPWVTVCLHQHNR